MPKTTTPAPALNPAAWSIGTQCVQGGYVPSVGGPRTLPIFQTTTYKYDDLDQVERLFALKEPGFKYTRTGNPTVAAFEAKIALLEGAPAAVATASGQSAVLLAAANIVNAGDHIVFSSNVYGGTHVLFLSTLRKLGVEATAVDPEAPLPVLRRAFRPRTRLLFGETIGNPALGILDFAKFARLAREFDVPLFVDNTLATPFLCQPLKHGAHIVIHSATKYIDGSATALGGAVIDGGTYNWANGKFPGLTDPDPLYAGTSYLKDFPAFPFAAKARAQYLRDLGASLSPFNAFILHHGLETLHLRMARHSDNALALARFLTAHPLVNWVSYPGLPGHPSHARLKKYFERPLASGVLTFGLKGDARAFVKALKLATLVVHIGDARTAVLHPATSTHSQLTRSERLAAGIPDDMIRVNTGIEDAPDILADFDQALKASKK